MVFEVTRCADAHGICNLLRDRAPREWSNIKNQAMSCLLHPNSEHSRGAPHSWFPPGRMNTTSTRWSYPEMTFTENICMSLSFL